MEKQNWIDRSLAIIGLIISFIGAFNLSGKVEDLLDWTKLLSIISLLLGIAIIVLIVYKNKTETRVSKIEAHKFYDSICDELKMYGANTKAIILNPGKSFNQIENLLNKLVEKDFKISIVGQSDNLISMLSFLSGEKLNSLKNNSYVINFSQDAFLFILLSDASNKMSIFFNSGHNLFLFSVSKKNQIITIRDSILKLDTLNEVGINLNTTNQPSKFLKLIQEEKQKYDYNFLSLKSGHISFYGTEVLNIQSSWVQNGNFKTIKTLDLTEEPSLLLTRNRYLDANRDFIKGKGSIQRVFLISKRRLEDDIFKQNLKAAVNVQRDLGVTLGLSFLEDLNQKQKQDFILYDDYAVLVEERQANSDYSFGKSTAYFHKLKIDEYQMIFDAVWNNNGKSVIQQLNETLK